MAIPPVKLPSPAEAGTRPAEAGTRPAAADKLDPVKLAKLTEAAQQFEAIFVRQLLKSTGFVGAADSAGYGSMMVDALANGVTQGGGLGLATAIRDSLLASELRKKPGA